MTTAFRSKKDLVHDRLRRALVTGELRPGDRVVIDEWARALEVSPIPVREAVQALVSDGFLVARPHAGPVVAPITAQSVREVFDLMEALEVIAGRAACEAPGALDLAPLRRALDSIDRAIERRRLKDWPALNRQFHAGICALAGYGLAASSYNRAADHWERIRALHGRDAAEPDAVAAQREHRAILDALERRDADRLEQVSRAHNQRARAAVLARIEAALSSTAPKEAA
jgi:DNA-binding GntR family transcriptional regulator